MIYQPVSKNTEILPLAISNIAHLCNQFNHAFAPLIFMLCLKYINFYHDRPENILFLQKKLKVFESSNCKFLAPRR